MKLTQELKKSKISKRKGYLFEEQNLFQKKTIFSPNKIGLGFYFFFVNKKYGWNERCVCGHSNNTWHHFEPRVTFYFQITLLRFMNQFKIICLLRPSLVFMLDFLLLKILKWYFLKAENSSCDTLYNTSESVTYYLTGPLYNGGKS